MATTQTDPGIDDDDALAALRTQADAGSPAACYRLACALVLRQQHEEALALHARAAQAGHVLAQIEFARMQLYGIASAADVQSAVQWFTRAEQAGAVVASYYLALIALGDVGLPRDGRINERLHRAMQADYPPALLAAAVHFGRKPHAEDQALCLQLLERGAVRGDPLAAALLAERLARGEGCVAQPEIANEMRAQLVANGFAPLPEFDVAMPLQASSPPRHLAIEDGLQAPPLQLRSVHPRIGVVERLLSADECRLLIAASQPMLRESRTVDPHTGLPVAMQIRTSSDASVDPILESLSLRIVQMRMASAAAIDLPHAEQLTVLRYAPGQEYRPHRDYVPLGTIERDRPQAGNRRRTICAYLNAVEAGGATEFPVAKLKVEPVPGSAVVFDNLRADGTPDPDSLHAGLPVERGEKWLATLWIRERRYRDF